MIQGLGQARHQHKRGFAAGREASKAVRQPGEGEGE